MQFAGRFLRAIWLDYPQDPRMQLKRRLDEEVPCPRVRIGDVVTTDQSGTGSIDASLMISPWCPQVHYKSNETLS